MSKTNIVIGALTGLAVGALLGILFAPDKGSETRRKISRKGSDTLEGLKDELDGLLDAFKEKFEAAKEDTETLLEKAMHKTEEFKK